jgi:putative membrane protein insertion efficiency factor
MRFALVGIIRFYQRYISAYTPPVCRFQPTCSTYALEAIQTHGAIRGVWLGTLRLLRCHPFHPGGYDPVPPLPGARG